MRLFSRKKCYFQFLTISRFTVTQMGRNRNRSSFADASSDQPLIHSFDQPAVADVCVVSLFIVVTMEV